MPTTPPVSHAAEPRPRAFGLTDRRLAIGGYALIVFLYWMALYFYVPTLPTYVQSKSSNLAIVGTVLSMYGFWQMLVRLPVGIAADWLGRRKPFLIGGLVLVGLGAWVMAVSPGVEGLLIGRAITGLAAATWVPLVVVFTALFEPHEAVRASALLTVVGSLGRIVATSSTGWLNERGGYALAFYVAIGVAALALILVLPMQEPRQVGGAPRPSRPSALGIGRLITRRDVLLPALLSAVAQYANWACTFGFLPILARELGTSDVYLSLVVSLNLVFLTGGNLAATVLVGRLGGRRMVYVGFVLTAAGIAATAIAGSGVALLVFQALLGLGSGMSYPILMGMSIEKVVDAERTTAMGLHQAVYAAGMFAGPWVGGLLADAMGVRLMFAVTAALSLVLGIAGTRALAHHRLSRHDDGKMIPGGTT